MVEGVELFVAALDSLADGGSPGIFGDGPIEGAALAPMEGPRSGEDGGGGDHSGDHKGDPDNAPPAHNLGALPSGHGGANLRLFVDDDLSRIDGELKLVGILGGEGQEEAEGRGAAIFH